MNRDEIVQALSQNCVVAYPTEAVFGLGCNPMSEEALNNLLQLKQRDINKGLILIAPTIDYFLPFLDFDVLTSAQIKRLTSPMSTPTTWVVPAKNNVPRLLKGRFESIAIRLCDHPAVVSLCKKCGFPLVSTSANLSGEMPCRTAQEVKKQFGCNFPVLNESVGKAQSPSQIRDLITNKILRG